MTGTDGQERPPVLPSRDDPVVRAMSTALGGPVGRRARVGDRRWWVPVRVLVLFAVIGATLGVVQKTQCATHGYRHDYQYTRFCYTDVLALWYGENLYANRAPTIDAVDPTAPDPNAVSTHRYVEYPVLIAAAMWGVQKVTLGLVPDGPSAAQKKVIARFADDQAQQLDQSGDQADRDRFAVDQYEAANAVAAYQARQARYFYEITAILLVLCAVAVVVCTGLTAGRRRIWDAALVGLCPVLVLHGTVNWDLIAVAFTSGALLAWARRRPWLAGALLGLGAATKLYPVLLLIPLLALCIRAGRMRAWGKAVGGAAGAWLLVNVPFMIASFDGWYYFYGFSRKRGTEYNSLFYAWEYFVRGPNDPRDQDVLPGGARNLHDVMNGVEAALIIVSIAAIFLLCLLVRRRPRLAQAAFLTALAFVLFNKVYSPQYALWLLPLVVLARPRWRYFLVWQLSEVLLMVTLYAHLVYVDTGRAKGVGYAWFFWVGDLPRDLVLLGLAALVIREMVHPELDVVRADGDDDPGGGVLDGAPDAFGAEPPPPPGWDRSGPREEILTGGG